MFAKREDLKRLQVRRGAPVPTCSATLKQKNNNLLRTHGLARAGGRSGGGSGASSANQPVGAI